jgi:hypothetical protein
MTRKSAGSVAALLEAIGKSPPARVGVQASSPRAGIYLEKILAGFAGPAPGFCQGVRSPKTATPVGVPT